MVLNQKYIEETINKYKNKKYGGIKITGVLHIGAHKCEEMSFYKKLGIKPENIIWIDAFPENVENAIKRKIPNVYQSVITNKDDESVIFHVANNIQSSSVLEFGTHQKDHPEIKFVNELKLKTLTIKTFFERNNIKNISKYNFWNFDIQGAELMALEGAGDLIKNVDILNLEVNTKEVYKNCPLMERDLDPFLKKYNFKRILTKITPAGWGDALYIKSFNHPKTYDELKVKNVKKTKKLIKHKLNTKIQKH